MSNVPSSFVKVQIESLQFRGPASESALQDIGAPINGLLDAKAANDVNISNILARLAAIEPKILNIASVTSTQLTFEVFGSGVLLQTAVLPVTGSRVVDISIQGFAGNTCGVGTRNLNGNDTVVAVHIRRNGTRVGGASIFAGRSGGVNTYDIWGGGQVRVLDVPGPGTHTYDIEYETFVGIGESFIEFTNCVLHARELAG